MIRMVVDFPAPLGPRKPVTRPACAVKLTSSTAVKPPYFLVSESTVIMSTSLAVRTGCRTSGRAGRPIPDRTLRCLGVRPRLPDNDRVSMPSRLGRYAVRRRIGSGGFATVWLAYDEQLDSPVAVKVLAENWTEDTQVRQRFLEEGRFLRKVESPYVVSVYDAGELDDGRPYLVMSYADQGTLADRLEVEGLTTAQAMEVVRQVGAGLQALHGRGVLHRDVKPANVLFRTVDDSAHGTTVRAMVADLGLGKALDMSSRLTMIAGTPTFVAPEQAQGEPLDPRADQYSLAALTYLLLSGRAPYRHASLAAAAAPGPAGSMSTPERPVPEAVEAVVRRGLAVDREDRWPDVASYVAALEAALGEEAAGAAPAAWLPLDPNLTQPGARPTPLRARGPLPEPVPPKRPRGRVLLGIAAAIALVAAAGVGWLPAPAARSAGRRDAQ